MRPGRHSRRLPASREKVIMVDPSDAAHSVPSWFVAPGQTDSLAWVALGLLCLALYGLLTLYAAFDRWAEHKSKGTPLAKTIPTLLAIALIYEVFPVEHFSLLLPLCAILVALMADWSRFHALVGVGSTEPEGTTAPASDVTLPKKEH